MLGSLAALKAEIGKKRKQIEDVEVEVDGKKFFKRADLSAKQDREYLEKMKIRADKEAEKEEKDNPQVENPQTSNSHKATEIDEKPFVEVRRILRERNQPILLFGESENDVRARLLKHQVEQPELKEGWKNEMQAAMQDVDDEFVKGVIEGTSGDASKHDVQFDSAHDDWEKIEQQATLLGLGDIASRDCDIIFLVFKYLLNRWGKVLNQRPDDDKKSALGKHAASIHRQTVVNMKPLMTSLEAHSCNNDIRHHLAKICRLLVLDRNYIEANNAYMEMAIGNSPWPVGVTRSGIHQRPGSAKSYVSNIAHVLNDETQRKYIQSIKRLMTKMQEYFPTDPSKCVEFVKS